MLDYTLTNFFPELCGSCTILPALFHPCTDKKKRNFNEYVIWPALYEFHFFLVIFAEKEEKLYVFNSLRGAVSRNTKILQDFQNYLNNNSFKCKLTMKNNLPQQRNNVDCGVYTILFFENIMTYISKKAKILDVKVYFSLKDVANKRRMIFDTLMEEGIKKGYPKKQLKKCGEFVQCQHVNTVFLSILCKFYKTYTISCKLSKKIVLEKCLF